MDIKEIMSYLPHRYPFLLVDRVVEVEAGKSIVAYKNITFNEPVQAGTGRIAIRNPQGAPRAAGSMRPTPNATNAIANIAP